MTYARRPGTWSMDPIRAQTRPCPQCGVEIVTAADDRDGRTVTLRAVPVQTWHVEALPGRLSASLVFSRPGEPRATYVEHRCRGRQ